MLDKCKKNKECITKYPLRSLQTLEKNIKKTTKKLDKTVRHVFNGFKFRKQNYVLKKYYLFKKYFQMTGFGYIFYLHFYFRIKHG